MGTFMLIVAVVVKFKTPDPNASSITPSGLATIAMVYLESASFNFSWGPVSWVYVGEIFNNQNREVGVAIGTASQWIFNFAVSKTTPYVLAAAGPFGTFLMFSVANFALVFFVYFIITEVRSNPPK